MTTLEKLKEKFKKIHTERHFYLKSYGVQFFFLFTLPWIDTGFQQQWVSQALDYSFAVLFYFLTGYTVLTIFHIKSDKMRNIRGRCPILFCKRICFGSITIVFCQSTLITPMV